MTRTPHRSSPGLAAAALLAGALFATASCGRKGDPLPPPRNVPATTQDLALHQQGNLLFFRLGYPQTTSEGNTLPGLRSVDLYEMVAPLPDPTRPPPVDPLLFTRQATRMLSMVGAELRAAVTGDRIEARVPLAEAALRDPAQQPELHVFAVRTVATTGEESDLSNLESLVFRPAAPAPAAFDARPAPDGVALTWQPAAGATVVGYNVYRRAARERGFGDPLATVPPDPPHHLDRTASAGERYIYTVRAVHEERPLVESSAAAEREVDYQDRFAPPIPQGVVALAEVQRVRLVWQASPAADLAGYHVERQDPGSASWRRVTAQPVRALEYLDPGLGSGLRFVYRLVAIDRVGNESPPSEAAAAIVE